MESRVLMVVLNRAAPLTGEKQGGVDVAGEGDECQTEEPDARVSYALHGEVGRVSVLLGWDAVSGGGDARCDEEPHTDRHDGEAEHDGESVGDDDEHDFLRNCPVRR